MVEATLVHELNCTGPTYLERIFFDEAYNRRLFLEELRFESWKQVDLEWTPTQIRRVVEAVPTTGDIPAPLRRLARGGLGYRETVTLDRAAGRLAVRVEPAHLKEQLDLTGTMYCETVDVCHCRRVYVAYVEARIPGLGRLIEQRILSDVRANYDRAIEFTNRFIAERGL